MTIANAREKCKSALAKVPRDLLVLAVLILASSASFGLGFLAGQGSGEAAPISITQTPLPNTPADTSGQFVASKNGTKYYPPGCAGASRISDANKVSFASAAEAEALGYQLASGCAAP